MPITPDMLPGPRHEEEVQFENQAVSPSIEGAVRYVNDHFEMVDNLGVFDPRGGTGLTAAQHQALRQLIHFIDDGPANGFPSGAYKEIVYSGILITSETWYEDNTKVKKLVEFTAAYTGVFPNTETWSMYDSDGVTVLATVTDTIVYSGVFETSRTRVIA